MADVKKRDLTMVPFELLQTVEGFNIRADLGDIETLKDNIKENGVKVPLRGYKEKGTDNYIIIDGHRRFAALSLLAKEGGETMYIPFVLEPQKYNDEQRVIDMFIMNDGKNLTPLEKAEGIRRLQNWGYSDKDIAIKTGCSPSYVGKLALLNNAPKRMILLIQNNKIAASLAMDIISKGETDTFLQQIESGLYNMQNITNGMQLPEKPTKTKITKTDVAPLNSWKEFKKWAANQDASQMDEEKSKFFKYICRMMNNELNENSFKQFFK